MKASATGQSEATQPLRTVGTVVANSFAVGLMPWHFPLTANDGCRRLASHTQQIEIAGGSSHDAAILLAPRAARLSFQPPGPRVQPVFTQHCSLAMGI
jgi:hypothetical protein